MPVKGSGAQVRRSWRTCSDLDRAIAIEAGRTGGKINIFSPMPSGERPLLFSVPFFQKKGTSFNQPPPCNTGVTKLDFVLLDGA
jgi:hypothetical protein